MPRPTPNSSSERQGAMPVVPEVAPAHGCAASRSALGNARADALPPSVPHTASGDPQLGGLPFTPINSPVGGASTKLPTAVASAVHDRLLATRVRHGHTMPTALRDFSSTATCKEPRSGSFIGGSNGLRSIDAAAIKTRARWNSTLRRRAPHAPARHGARHFITEISQHRSHSHRFSRAAKVAEARAPSVSYLAD